DFLATTDDELSAQTGDIVYKLFDDNEWVYVISEQGLEGFIPLICVSLLKDTSLNQEPKDSFKRKTKQSSLQLPQRTNDSMLAEEGSDASDGSRNTMTRVPQPKETDVVAPPKPARGLTLDIPDRINTSSSVSGEHNAVEATPQRNQRNSTSSHTFQQKTHLTSSQTSLSSDPITEVRTFSRKPRGKLLVIFPFEAWDEGDMSVDRGEVVTALNTEDPLWTMVRKLNGQEGFVPAAFTCNYPEDLPGAIGTGADNKSQRGDQQTKKPNYHDVRDLVTLRDFTAQSADDISVMVGEQVFADLANQIEREWLWVYAPSTGKYGYIPRDNVVHADRSPIPTELELRKFAQRPP
ncbi:hypothetical protein EGW08_000661, partial [Elysia chlorotica]